MIRTGASTIYIYLNDLCNKPHLSQKTNDAFCIGNKVWKLFCSNWKKIMSGLLHEAVLHFSLNFYLFYIYYQKATCR